MLAYLVNQYFQGEITFDELYDKFNEYIYQEVRKGLEEHNNETKSKS